jgi:U32 family peptidase
LIVDDETVYLGDRRYLLSPQDLAGLDVLPELIQSGVTCLKIEGRLKSPEYVANVTRVYRDAIDKVTQSQAHYKLEMAFSRGLSTGWFRGINNQELVHARFGKKRGVYLGDVTRVQNDQISVRVQAPVKPGDGVVFDCGHPEAKEEGGRIYAVNLRGKETILTFGKHDLNFRRIQVGDRIWKTSDPELDRQVRQTYAGDTPKFHRPIQIEVHGEVDQNLVAIASDSQGHGVEITSSIVLSEAQNQPLSSDRLKEQFGRLGNTPFSLGALENHIKGNVMLPISELNRMRREIVEQLEDLRSRPKRWTLHENASLAQLLPERHESEERSPELISLVRNFQQLETVLEMGIQTIYCEFEDPRAYRQAVEIVRSTSASVWVAPPRITKPSENWILQQVRRSEADGYLIRNYDQIRFFERDRTIGDFSLNIANPLTADYFKPQFERLTASYDLNIGQLTDLLTQCSPDWFEITIHQHMPMFHMEHCVFCAFLSEGTDFTNCGRPCEEYQVRLRDRTGTENVLQADAGCRNTVFNGTAQTGAEHLQHLLKLGVRQFRIEFVNESSAQVKTTLDYYDQLLQGKITGIQLWRALNLQNQLGVTRGTLR